jgi:hypothetical protein
LNKEIGHKKNTVSWSIDCLARAFREMYSTLNWFKVFEALSNINDADIKESDGGEIKLD